MARALTVPVTTRDSDFEITTADGPRVVRAREICRRGSQTRRRWRRCRVHHLGIEEPRLRGFARAMASCGIRVLTPELPGIKDYHVSRESVRTIGESVKWYAKQTGGPVGVMGLSLPAGWRWWRRRTRRMRRASSLWLRWDRRTRWRE